MHHAFLAALALVVSWRVARLLGWPSAVCAVLSLPFLAGAWLTFVFPETRELSLPALVLALLLGAASAILASRRAERMRRAPFLSRPRAEPYLTRR